MIIKLIRRVLPAALILVMVSGAVFADEITVQREPGFSNFSRKQDYTVGHFADVSTKDWFASSVQNVFELGLMNGKSSASFAPYEPVKVSEAISMAAKTHDVYSGGDGALPDTGSVQWYGDALNYAIKNQIIRENDFSDYDADATRAQLAYIFSGAVPEETLAPVNAVTSVPDISKNASYADDILKLYRAGIVSGSDKTGTYHPQQSITRGEAAIILSRIAVPSRRISFTLEAPAESADAPEDPAAPAGGDAAGTSGNSAGDAAGTGGNSAGDAAGTGGNSAGVSDNSGNGTKGNADGDKTGAETEEGEAAPISYNDQSGAFRITVPAESAPFWTTTAAVSQPLSLNLIRYDKPVPAKSSRTERKLPGQKDEFDGSSALGGIMGFTSSRQEAVAPTQIFHSLTVKSLAKELSGREVIPAVYFSLKDGSRAYITPLLSGTAENAWYWVVTVEDGGQFITLTARARRGESTEMQNEIITVIKSIEVI